MSNETWLFGAEVNRIQDTLFAAGLQRQVVGGSRMLAVFTEEAAKKADVPPEDIIVQAGGNFRIVFKDEQKAKDFGTFIATAYHLLLDGLMTVSAPVLFVDRGDENCDPDDRQCEDAPPCFTCANYKLENEMGMLKRKRPFAITSTHAPTNAFCQSSGTQSAEYWESLEDDDQYMSGPAQRMKTVGYVEKKGEVSTEKIDANESFLHEIRQAIPDGKYRNWDWVRRPEAIAEWDPTQNNVAYLVADGNNMGKYFRACHTPEIRRQLSEALLRIVYEAIAEPIALLTDRLFDSYLANQKDECLPLLPLIAAGDDVFVLLPAPYALDYARRFCLSFSEKMNEQVEKMGLGGDLPDITMSAAVVFCKQSYPYLLAHQFGEGLLAQTKQVVKAAKTKEDWHSAVSVDVIIGSAGNNGRIHTGEYRPTLRTYWAKDEVDNKNALPLKRLFDQRLNLDLPQESLPAKRRAELRTLFDQPPGESAESFVAWNGRYQKLMRRIERTTSQKIFERLEAAVQALGSEADIENGANWFSYQLHDDANPIYGHGLPDLLLLWNYAQSLDEALSRYN